MTLPQLSSIFVLWCCLSLSCSPPRDTRALALSKIHEIADLSLVEYDLSKVVAVENHHWIRSTATFLAKTEATVSYGIDLNDFDRRDVDISGKAITIRMPQVILTNFSYPAEKMVVEEKYTQGNFWNQIDNEEREEAYRLAEADIRSMLPHLPFEAQVQDQFKTLLYPVLQQAGFTEIYFVRSRADSTISSEGL